MGLFYRIRMKEPFKHKHISYNTSIAF